MNLLSETTEKKTFNLLSIGQRGVGKTVFLAGSYAELHPNSQVDHSQKLWFDCQDKQAQENIENILNYIARTGQYPPPTMKITNFNFSLKRRNLWGVQTLCHFRWWDTPGEACNIQNLDFQTLVLTSHGCCVFINADELVHNQAYLQVFENIVKQVVTIASLTSQHGLKYLFALILTQCDLLGPGPLSLLQIEESLQPLITRLDAAKAHYQRFYSAIPIVSTGSTSTLRATGAAAPLLWLISELRKSDNFQSQPDLASGLAQGLSNSASNTSTLKKRFGLNLPSTAHRYRLILILAGVGLLGVIASIFLAFDPLTLGPEEAQTPEGQIREYEQVLQREPDNFDALINLAKLRIQLGQPDQAIPLMEKLIQQEPESLDLHLTLAQLYELTSQEQRAEALYDEVLAKQKNNLKALVGKAVLRHAQGDTETAETLFAQAEKAAPSDLKGQVRTVAQETLQTSPKPVTPTK
jgi:tetratricopeptide (TPR) repeat protein